MTADLATRLREAGATLRAESGRLFLRMPDGFPPDLLAEARAHKPELLDALAGDAETDPQERGPAIQSLPQAAMVSGLMSASRKRPPSWADPAAAPSPGCYCGCCRAQTWWTEAAGSLGWRCVTCHPPLHLGGKAVRRVET